MLRDRAAGALPVQGLLSGRGDRSGAVPDFLSGRATECLAAGRPRSGAGRSPRVGATLAAGRTAGTRGWSSHLDQGRPADGGMVDPLGLDAHLGDGIVGRRRPCGGAPARARRGSSRQDEHLGISLEDSDGQPAHRDHAQPLEPRPHPRRQLRRRDRGGGGGHGTAGSGNGRRRLHPRALRIHRCVRPQAHVRPGSAISGRRIRNHGARGADCALRGRCGAAAHRHFATRPPGLACPAVRGSGLPRGTGFRGPRPHDRVQSAPGAGRRGPGGRPNRGGRRLRVLRSRCPCRRGGGGIAPLRKRTGNFRDPGIPAASPCPWLASARSNGRAWTRDW